MKNEEVKQILLAEAAREKRIVLRNTIIIGSIAVIGLLILLFLTRDFIIDFFTKPNKTAYQREGIEGYIPYIAMLVIVAVVYFSISASLKRTKTVYHFFKLLEQGEKVTVFNEEKKSLTNVFLFVVTLKFDPIFYLTFEVNKGMYTLPIPEYLLTDIKRFIEFGQQEEYTKVMDDIYGYSTDAQVQNQEDKGELEYEVELKPTTEFSAYFSQNFGKEIDAMERERKTSKRKVSLIFGTIIFFVLAYSLLFMLLGQNVMREYNTIFLVGGLLIVIALIRFVYAKKDKGRYVTNSVNTAVDHTTFKETMLTRLAHYIHPNFSYYEKGHVGLPEVFHSGIFQQKSYRISGGDQFVGHYNGVSFQSCSLSLSCRPMLSRDKDPDDEVFQGSFFVAKFPKKFSTNLLIFPKQGILNSFTGNCIGNYLNTSGEVIRLEDPEFQKLFTVYCDDQVAARYVLTPSFMEKLKQLNLQNKGNMYCGINGNNIVIATNNGKSIESTTDLVGNIFNTTKLDQNFLDKVYVGLIEQLRVIDMLNLDYKK